MALMSNVIEAGSGDDVIHTGAGEDEIFGGLGDDRIFAGAGNDRYMARVNTRLVGATLLCSRVLLALTL